MSRPKDVINAKFFAESNGCVGGLLKKASRHRNLSYPSFKYLIVLVSGSKTPVVLKPRPIVVSSPPGAPPRAARPTHLAREQKMMTAVRTNAQSSMRKKVVVVILTKNSYFLPLFFWPSSSIAFFSAKFFTCFPAICFCLLYLN